MRTAWDHKLVCLVGTSGRHQTELVIRASGATSLRKGYVGEPNTVRAGRTLDAGELDALRPRLAHVRTAGHYGDEPDHVVRLVTYDGGKKYETSFAWAHEMGVRVWGSARPPAALEALLDDLLALRERI